MPWQSITGFKTSTPVNKLPDHIMDIILYGTKGEKIRIEYDREYGSGAFAAPFEGVINSMQRRYRETQSDGNEAVLRGVHEQQPLPGVQRGKAQKRRAWP
jgi:excinuclease ABC subunit A